MKTVRSLQSLRLGPDRVRASVPVSPVLADGNARSARPFEVDFDKCFDRQGDAPYLFTFSGTVSGDVSGTLEARVAVLIPNVQPNQNYLQADYVVATDA